MNKRFHDDALRWEEGSLSRSEFIARHPEVDVAGLVGLHDGLASMAIEPTPDPQPRWVAIEERLPARHPKITHVSLRSRRTVLAMSAAAIIGGTSVAYAAGVTPVRAGVDRVVDSVTHLFKSGDAAVPAGTSEPSPTSPPGTEEPTPSVRPSAEPSPTDGGSGGGVGSSGGNGGSTDTGGGSTTDAGGDGTTDTGDGTTDAGGDGHSDPGGTSGDAGSGDQGSSDGSSGGSSAGDGSSTDSGSSSGD